MCMYVFVRGNPNKTCIQPSVSIEKRPTSNSEKDVFIKERKVLDKRTTLSG